MTNRPLAIPGARNDREISGLCGIAGQGNAPAINDRAVGINPMSQMDAVEHLPLKRQGHEIPGFGQDFDPVIHHGGGPSHRGADVNRPEQGAGLQGHGDHPPIEGIAGIDDSGIHGWSARRLELRSRPIGKRSGPDRGPGGRI